MLHGKLHRFSVEDYYMMIPAGILPERHAVELLEGLVVDLP